MQRKGKVIKQVIVKDEVEQIEATEEKTNATAKATAKATTEQSSGSADQPNYKQRVDADYWRNQTVSDIIYQISLRGVRKRKPPDGTNMRKADYLRELLSMI